MALPVWEDPSATFGDGWAACCVWRVDQEKNDTYTLEHVGSRIKDWLGEDISGLIYGNLVLKFPNTRLVKKSPEVIKNRFPLIDEDVYINDRGVPVKFRNCMIPFGAQGKVSHILLGMSWIVS